MDAAVVLRVNNSNWIRLTIGVKAPNDRKKSPPEDTSSQPPPLL